MDLEVDAGVENMILKTNSFSRAECWSLNMYSYGTKSYWSSYAYVRSLIMNKPFSFSALNFEFFSDNWNKEI